MRILIVNNFYGSSAPSGENRAVIEECDALRAAGHDVIEFFTHSDSVRDRGILPVIRAGFSVPWNSFQLRAVRNLIFRCEPDVMHVHNVFPLLSPAIFWAAANTRTAVVNTLHNYRTVCPAAMPLRNTVVCTECIETKSTAPALRHGCYRNSRLATIPLAASVTLHRRLHTYIRHVDAFIALTEFQRSLLIQGGLPEKQIYVKPNSYAGSPAFVPWEEREDKVVFLGRISAEKGVDTLIKAWVEWDVAPRLEIIGGGPDLERLRRLLPAHRVAQIEFVGQRSPDEARALLSKAKLIIVPSTWFEGFPLVLCEAFAFGVPIVASRFGTFEELVASCGAGWLFNPGDAADLLARVVALWRDQISLRQASDGARREFENKYNRERNINTLHDIYSRAIETRRTRLNSMGNACHAAALLRTTELLQANQTTIKTEPRA
jgi:glycosyltransferase involved in cell wall biosynthesis